MTCEYKKKVRSSQPSPLPNLPSCAAANWVKHSLSLWVLPNNIDQEIVTNSIKMEITHKKTKKKINRKTIINLQNTWMEILLTFFQKININKGELLMYYIHVNG